MPPSQPQPPPPQTSLPTPRALLTNLITTLSSKASDNPIPSGPHPPDNPLLPTNLSAQTLTSAKPLLLTLHALFPHTLLPALDLLDRRLVARLVYTPPSSSWLPASREDESGNEGGGGGVGGVVRGDTATAGASGASAGGGDDLEREREREEQQEREGGVSEKKKRITTYYVKSSSSSSSAQQQGRSRSRIYGGSSNPRSGEVATWYEVRTQGWSCSCKAFAFGAFNAGVGEYEEQEEMLLDEDDGGEENEGEWRWGGLMVGENDAPLCKHLFACVLAEHWGFAREMVEEREVGREEMAGWAAGWGD